MFGDSEDILGLETTPEMRAASDLLMKSAEAIAGYSLPLKKAESTCALKCFSSIHDHWNMSTAEKTKVMDCIERCEEPMEMVVDMVETERSSLIEAAVTCLERCEENDEACANKCITQCLTIERVDSMVDRVRAKIDSFRF